MRWLPSVMPSSEQVSFAPQPSTSRSAITWRRSPESRSIDSRTTASVSACSRRSSPQGSGARIHRPACGEPGPKNRSGGTASSASSSASAERGTDRPSRVPRDLARLATMPYIQQRRGQRPSNRGRPARMPIQASCTTSSALARVETNSSAYRTIQACSRRTRAVKASSSPASKSATRRASSRARGSV